MSRAERVQNFVVEVVPFADLIPARDAPDGQVTVLPLPIARSESVAAFSQVLAVFPSEVYGAFVGNHDRRGIGLHVANALSFCCRASRYLRG
jgi:hypothetical protein